ncbi:hypothetical protein GCM10010425_30780 [Streptomyces spororaveus]|uniref:Uncharacterized protein n=1 Tax=Streptomyces spororaveus TaxID=284039 RepID=A0ABQ3T680_9ACTN|nr:hypothetical protein Sspor_14620 [Streptomyces spororaveus]
MNRGRSPAAGVATVTALIWPALRERSELDKLVLAKWVINQEEWKRLLQDIEGLAPRDF